MNHSELLSLLLPPDAYDPRGHFISAELTAEGSALDHALDYADQVAGTVTPYFAGALLVDWERLVGITPDIAKPALARIQAVVAKIRETGGLSISYFTSLAASMGYTITIVEPQPFRAGTSRAGDVLYGYPDILWQWRIEVHAASVPQYPFRAGTSCAGESLLAFGDPIIEAVFQDLKPAHTYCYFAYL